MCDHVGIDPYTSISEGTLIATVVPDRAIGYVEACVREGIDAAIVGEVTDPSEGRVVVDADGGVPWSTRGSTPSGARSAPGHRRPPPPGRRG